MREGKSLDRKKDKDYYAAALRSCEGFGLLKYVREKSTEAYKMYILAEGVRAASVSIPDKKAL
ncbi:MAG: hypothetical protein MTP17_04090 [Candidatus Midichloria sp.]|nr:MAG: hypothetical protein MTP17_04090 [Candidatus Midichloria sp.]